MVVSYLDFVEERLDTGIDYGAVGGMSFQTEIINSGEETEQRNCTRWLPLGRWQLGQRIIYEGDDKLIDEVSYLREFHRLRKGSQQGFRFKDWSDYQAVNQHIGTTDGLTTQWQLLKNYHAGTAHSIRMISKPVEGTVKIYLDNVQTLPAIDHSTGLITFAVPPVAGQIITADFEFDVPVTFEKDEINWELKAVKDYTGEKLYQLGSVFVNEVRIDSPIRWNGLTPLPDLVFQPLNLGMILDANERNFFSTRAQSLASGFKSTLSNRDNKRTQIKINNRYFTQAGLNSLLNFFWAAKGRAVRLKLILNNKLYLARFDSDSFSAKFEIQEEAERLWQVNLNFLAFKEVPVFSNFKIVLLLFGNNFVDSSINNNVLSMVGSVPINNESFELDSPNNYLEVAHHPDFNFGDNDFYIQFDFWALTYLDNCFPIALWQPGESSFWVRFHNETFQLALSESGNGGQGFTFNFPDMEYYNGFQNVRIVRSPDTDPNFDRLSFYYNNQLTQETVIAHKTLFAATSGQVTIGEMVSNIYSSGTYLIKNLVVAKEEISTAITC